MSREPSPTSCCWAWGSVWEWRADKRPLLLLPATVCKLPNCSTLTNNNKKSFSNWVPTLSLSQFVFYSLTIFLLFSLSLSLSIFFHKQKVVWKSAHQSPSKRQDFMKTNALWSLITTKSVACHNWKPESYQQVINCTLYSWSKKPCCVAMVVRNLKKIRIWTLQKFFCNSSKEQSKGGCPCATFIIQLLSRSLSLFSIFFHKQKK